MANLILRASDGTEFKVDSRIKGLSNTIKDLPSVARDGMNVFLPAVRGPVLKKIVDWTIHHLDDPPVNEEFYLESEVSEWDLQFLKVDNEFLYELYRAADYLEVSGLEILCWKALYKVVEGLNGDVCKIMELFKIDERDRPNAELLAAFVTKT